jgi:hypothetical protein
MPSKAVFFGGLWDLNVQDGLDVVLIKQLPKDISFPAPCILADKLVDPSDAGIFLQGSDLQTSCPGYPSVSGNLSVSPISYAADCALLD